MGYQDILTAKGLGTNELALRACVVLAQGDKTKLDLAVNVYELGVAEGVSRASQVIDEIIKAKQKKE